MKRALVLSGGGSRGAYQIGVCEALNKLKIKIDIVTGTSIGALNGALIVQNDLKKAKKLWNNLSYANVFDSNFENDGEIIVYKEYIKAFFKNGGMEVNALSKTIKENINIKKFYTSKIDFGLTTFKLNTLTPVFLTKKDIEENALVDYLLASATCYPAFKQKKIGKDIYIDGGYYDNLPINLALKMGADEVIAIDLKAMGRTKKTKKNTNIKYIIPKNKLGNFLIFDKNEAKRQISLGYNDTMKTYNILSGDKYTFYKNGYTTLEKKYLENYDKGLLGSIKMKTVVGTALKENIYGHKNFSKNTKKQNISFLDAFETLIEIFEFDEENIYRIKWILKKINRKIKDMPPLSIEKIEKSITDKTVNASEIARKYLIIYLQELFYKQQFKKSTVLAILFPKEYAAAFLLYTINNN